MENLTEIFVKNDEIVNIVLEIKLFIKEDRYNNDSIKDLKKDYPDRIEKLEEDLLNYIGEKYPKILKIEFPDNRWKYLFKKLAYPY